MPRRRFSTEQTFTMLREAEVLLNQSSPVAEVCRKMGISEQTFFSWNKKYGGLNVSELRGFKQLEEENRQLKRLVADLTLDKQMLQDVLSK